jgi:hypothetical protein
VGLFQKPSRVLLLKNMVGAADADDQLAAETEQECCKYGPVARCVVHVVTDAALAALANTAAGTGSGRCPEEERVRIFVEFERQESAVRAFRYCWLM